MPDADQVLMRRFQEGDESAFQVLVHKYQGLVLALARRYLGSRYHGIEDVAQQVFVRVFRSKMTYKPRAKVKTWLYSITVNASLNEIRRLRAQKNRRVSAFTAVFGGKLSVHVGVDELAALVLVHPVQVRPALGRSHLAVSAGHVPRTCTSL